MEISARHKVASSPRLRAWSWMRRQAKCLFYGQHRLSARRFWSTCAAVCAMALLLHLAPLAWAWPAAVAQARQHALPGAGYAAMAPLLAAAPRLARLGPLAERVGLLAALLLSLNAGNIASAAATQPLPLAFAPSGVAAVWELSAGGRLLKIPAALLCAAAVVSLWRGRRYLALHLLLVLVAAMLAMAATSDLSRPVLLMAPLVMALAALGVFALRPPLRMPAVAALVTLSLLSALAGDGIAVQGAPPGGLP